jgi:uncharacterized membrane protein YbhN (UPF0104 family)
MKAEKFFTVFGLIVFCIAAYLRYRALGHYNLEEIRHFILNLSMPRVAMATLFVACSYFILTLFDAVVFGTCELVYRLRAGDAAPSPV